MRDRDVAGGNFGIDTLIGRTTIRNAHGCVTYLPVYLSTVSCLLMSQSSHAQQTSVVLADDHALVNEGLRSLIDRQPDMEVIHTVYNGDELLTYLAGTRW